MDFYEGVVIDYLRADRAVFINTQCCIQLEDGPNPDVCKPHWYCDALAVDFRNEEIFLCEISYADKLDHLNSRLRSWSEHWPKLRDAIERDCRTPKGWPIRPWLFLPDKLIPTLAGKLKHLHFGDEASVVVPRITSLESVQPWLYRSWDHQDKASKKPNVPDMYRT